jgi:Protein of unknown function (DUF5672)
MKNMEVVNVFLEEIFDVELSQAAIRRYVDETSNSLKLGSILKDPVLHSNLVFRYVWKSVTGVFPSKLHAAAYMGHANLSGDIDLNEFFSYLKSRVPLYNYISVDTQTLTAVKSKFVQELSVSQNVKQQLALKFAYRFGVDQDDIDLGDSLFTIFKKCIFSPVGYGRMVQMNTRFASLTEKEELAVPKVPETLTSYYKVSKNMIDYYELANLNVLTRYWNDQETASASRTTVFDQVNHVLSLDSNLYRIMLGSSVVCWDSGDAQSCDRLLHLVTSACPKDDNRNLVLLRLADTPNVALETGFHYYDYRVPERFLLNFLPKLAANYVLVGEDVFPQSPILSTKAESSIYYCLHRGTDAQEDKSVKKRPTYYAPFNRYVVPLDSKVPETITDKHAYSFVEATGGLVSNKHFLEHQWNAHLSTVCPFSVSGTPAYNPKQNVLLYDQFIVRYFEENEDRIVRAKPSKNAENVVVLVDNRSNIFSVIALSITLANLDTKLWSAVVVCNRDNESFFRSYFGDSVEYITQYALPAKKFSIDLYNDLLKDPFFWSSFTQYKKTLFVQDDGMIIRPGVETEFLEYSYVGAPWRREWATQDPNKFIQENINPELVGNGGVSLRDVKDMKFVCETYRHLCRSLHYDRVQQQPEDVFFSMCCTKEKMKMPDYETAKRFASEQVCNESAYGFHKPWVYHDLGTTVRLFNAYLTKPLGRMV